MDGFAVDTTPCFFDEKRFWLTTQFESPDQRNNDNLWQINDWDGDLQCLAVNDYSVRGAGHIIASEAVLIRPSQNCGRGYGESLIFNYGCVQNGMYQEKRSIQVVPPGYQKSAGEVEVSCEGLKGYCSGLHTYNTNSNYEVIDLRFSENHSAVTLFKNLVKHISNKIRK